MTELTDDCFKPLICMALRVASDMRLFEFVDKPTDLDELVEKTSADRMVLRRILSAVSSVGYLKQTDVNTWEATPMTYAIRVPALSAWLEHHFDSRLMVYDAFPKWLAKRHYQSTASVTDCVLSEVFGMPVWEFHERNPGRAAVFDLAISTEDQEPPERRPPYPFNEQLSDLRSDDVTLVDIGGGHGQAVQTMRSLYPYLTGRFIVQDLPKTVETIDPKYASEAGFEPMVHDFFTPQPIKGAKYYHMRRVLHDWNDETAAKILKHTHEAMKDSADYSRLLICDFVLPDIGAGMEETMLDLMMFTVCGGMERTESHFAELLHSCGFKIVKIWKAPVGAVAIIEAAIA